MAARKPKANRSDTRSTATITGAGWTLTRLRPQDPRFVARRQIIEDDHSITSLFESSLTLAALAKQVERREREEGNIIGSQANVARQKETA